MWGARSVACTLRHQMRKEDFPLTQRGFASRQIALQQRRLSLHNSGAWEKDDHWHFTALIFKFLVCRGETSAGYLLLWQWWVKPFISTMAASVPASPEPGSWAQGMDYLSKGKTGLLNNFLASSLQTGDRTQIQRSPYYSCNLLSAGQALGESLYIRKTLSAFGVEGGGREQLEDGREKGERNSKNKKETRDQQYPLGHGGPML